jgi:hypothetical protein
MKMKLNQTMLKLTLFKLLSQYPRISAIIFSSLIAAIIGFIIRYIFFSYFNLDILSIENPSICIFSLFNLNMIRSATRYYLEDSLTQPLAMNIGDIIDSDTPPVRPSGKSVGSKSTTVPSGSTSSVPSGSSSSSVPSGSASGSSKSVPVPSGSKPTSSPSQLL